MDKEEYIFLNKKYENAVTAIKAHLFDVISNEEKKAMRIGLEMSREGISEEQYKELQELAMKQGEDLGRVITLTSKLSDVLVRLDTYTRTLRELRKAKASTEEVEKSIQATAAEVIVGINETSTDQNTKDKVIENVGAIAEATQVEIPEVANVQPAPAEVAPEAAPAVETPVVEATPEVAVETPAVEAAPAVEALPAEPVVETAVAETPAIEVAPAVEALPAEPVAEAAPVVETPVEEVAPAVEATPVVETPVVEVAPEAPAVETPVVEAAPVAPAVETPVVEAAPVAETTPVVETTPLIAVETAPEAAPAVETVPVVETPVVEAAPLIPVEAPVAEATPEAPAVVEAAPAVDASAPLIPVEEPATPAVEATPVVETAPVVDASAPLIPVEEPKVEETVAEAAPAVVEAAPVVETAGPLIPIEEPTAEATVEAPAVATAEVAAVDNDTVHLIPLPEEVSAPTEAETGAAKEVEVSVENTLPTNTLIPEVPAVDSPSSVVDNPVEAQEEEKVEVVEDTAPKKEIFTKNDVNGPKALLTSAKQIGNLRKSLSTQDALLGARLNNETNTNNALENQLVESGLLPADTETIKKQIEQMMEQANALYKDGKTQEAQDLYDKISAMNKQIQEETNKSLSV